MTNIKKFFILWLVLSVSVISFYTNATDVFVETDFSSGKGLLRQVGDTCLVYTPKHVVDDSDGIYVSSRLQRDAIAAILTNYPQDLAILQLAPNSTSICSESSWKDEGGRVRTVLDSVKNATLSFRKKNGALTEFPLRITSKDLHTYFYVELENNNQEISQGMSGSIVYVGSYPMGMLISVKDGTGRVLRMDTIAALSRSVVEFFAFETELLSQKSSDLTAFSSSPAKLIRTNKKQDSVNSKVIEGRISEEEGDELKEFSIISLGHTAYRLVSKKQNDDVRIRYNFISPSGKVLFSEDFNTGEKDYTFGFGTYDEGEYRLVVRGINDGIGTYSFVLEEVATPEQLTGESNVLGNQDIAQGYISQGTSAIYKI
ncbi:hypothetical protein, partial [Vibrio cyclitrophicus]